MNAAFKCSTGQPVCTATTPKSNGSTCSGSGCTGFSFGCDGSGTCVAGDEWQFSTNSGYCVATVYYCPGTTPPSPLDTSYQQLSSPTGCDYDGCPAGQTYCQRNFCLKCPGGGNCNNSNCPTWATTVYN